MSMRLGKDKPEMVERVARAIYAAFDAQGEYVGDHHFAGRAETTLDGRFDLAAIARAAIEALREPTWKMGDAGCEAFEKWEAAGGNSETIFPHGPIWRAMIDKALKGK